MRKFKIAVAALVASTCFLGVGVASAGTVSAKTVTAKPNYKKAPKVKVGTTIVKVNKKGSTPQAVKFVAPKTGKYVFTMGEVTIPAPDEYGKFICHGYCQICTADRFGLAPKKVKTKYGKDFSLYLCTMDSFLIDGDSGAVYCSLPERSATVKLKKGKKIYVTGWFTDPHATYRLTIKRKK